jgi:hypothetical protein
MPAERSQRRMQSVIRVAFDIKDDEDIHKLEARIIRAIKPVTKGRRHVDIVSSTRSWRSA